MAARSTSFWPVLTAIAAVALAFIALPDKWKTWAPDALRAPSLHFGLDLAGGTQLDFRISEDELHSQLDRVNGDLARLESEGGSPEALNQLRLEKQVIEEQKLNLIEAIRTVLERRINALGVSEATITPSYIGDEKHLLVECPGVVDIQQCIQTVGKTIQLEFKEEFTDVTAEHEKEVLAKVAAAKRRITGSGVSLQTLGQDLGDELGMGYLDERWYFRDELPQGLEGLWDASPGGGVQETSGSIKGQTQNDAGEIVEQEEPGVFLAEVLRAKTMTGRVVQEAAKAFEILAKEEQGLSYRFEEKLSLDQNVPGVVAGALRSMKAGELRAVELPDGSAQILFSRLFTPGREEADASHILVTYKGANGAPPDVTRTKEEALARAQSLKQQLTAGAPFEDLARAQSDGPSKENAGRLPPFARGTLVPSFEDVAFSAPVGEISDPVETPFGYHIIRVNKAPATTPDQAATDILTISGPDALPRANTYIAQLQSGEVSKQEEAVALRLLFFSLKPTGWKDTALDGKHFRTAAAAPDPTTGIPIVQISFDEEGGKLFQELTKRNIGKRIAIFVGGALVTAPTVNDEISGGVAVITGSQSFDEATRLAQDLNTGAIPAPIHLVGQRTVEATLGAEALRTSVQAALVGIVIVMLYMLIAYRALGALANIALILYAILFLAILKLPLFLFSNQYIVLTLAGAAGLILSIGMAVDANVLVFERVKEELRKGKLLKTAVETGFEKAWPSVRDSNIATLITCAILFIIGTSIVRGFAITLSMGVMVSMFTGIVVSRHLARLVATTSLSNTPGLFPGMKKNDVAQSETTAM